MKFAFIALIVLILSAGVIAQTEETASTVSAEMVNAKMDVLINQYSTLAKAQADAFDRMPDRNEVGGNFAQLDASIEKKINFQFPNLVIILIGNNLIVVGAILLLKRYRVI